MLDLEIDKVIEWDVEGVGDLDIFGNARVVLAGFDTGDDSLVGMHHECESLLREILRDAMRLDLLTKAMNAVLHLFLFIVHGAKGTLMTNRA